MTQEVQKWADPAMFAAQPQPEAEDGPQVQLLSCTPDPLGTIAACAHAYQGKFHSSLAEITDEERKYFLEDVRKNVLAAPLEFVHLHFRITGVTRGFTHQMVRQRTACYAQESTRFAVKETVPVALPPSLMGTVSWGQWWNECRDKLFPAGLPLDHDMTIVNRFAAEQASQEQLWRRDWDEEVANIDATYNALVNSGMPAEDARGLLPTNLLTQLNYTTSLRHLIDHAGLRLCTQAQFEWRLVWVKILEAIRDYGENQFYEYPNPDTGQRVEGYATWQFNAIADLFKPICYKTGKCEFMSDGDRYCSIRERVEEYHRNGITSNNWGSDSGINLLNKTNIPPIHDIEWLADPKAARQ